MMIEGTVAANGSVKVAKSEEANSLLKLVEAALESINGEEAYTHMLIVFLKLILIILRLGLSK